MNTKKSNTIVPKAFVKKAFDKSKAMATKANNFALASTEEIVTEGIDVVSQWQNVSETMINGGLKLASKQQDLFFEALHSFKSQYALGKKRVTKLIA
jgi:hypothetical protein